MNNSVVCAVVPSYVARIEALRSLSQQLRKSSVFHYIVPTSRDLTELLDQCDIPMLRIGRNPGFSATINWAASQLPARWDWLVICNDDIEIDPQKFSKVIASLKSEKDSEPMLAYLDPVRNKRIPQSSDVLLNLSLLGPLTAKVLKVHDEPVNDPHRFFRPFSCVALNRALWERIGGLDERFIFTYEDAYFARQAAKIGTTVKFMTDTGVVHHRHSTARSATGHNVAVAKASTWSAREYLRTLGWPKELATGACALSVAVRAVLLTVRRRRVDQLVSGFESIWALVCDERPHLAPYSSLHDLRRSS